MRTSICTPDSHVDLPICRSSGERCRILGPKGALPCKQAGKDLLDAGVVDAGVVDAGVVDAADAVNVDVAREVSK